MQLVTFQNVTITIPIADTEPASNAYTQLCNGIAPLMSKWNGLPTPIPSDTPMETERRLASGLQSEAQQSYFRRMTKRRSAVS